MLRSATVEERDAVNRIPVRKPREPMRPPARLIIPLWGSIYAEKLTSMTLPELLAPGNLPALSAMLTSTSCSSPKQACRLHPAGALVPAAHPKTSRCGPSPRRWALTVQVAAEVRRTDDLKNAFSMLLVNVPSPKKLRELHPPGHSVPLRSAGQSGTQCLMAMLTFAVG
jgi:hypothetical protein